MYLDWLYTNTQDGYTEKNREENGGETWSFVLREEKKTGEEKRIEQKRGTRRE
jgi:hypothetical protein